MADDQKKYISIINYDRVGLFIKDTEAHTAIENLQTTVSGHTTDIGNLQTSVASNTSEIANIKSSITGAMHYIGESSTAIEEGDVQGPWTIDGIVYDNEYLAWGSGSAGDQFFSRDSRFDETTDDGQGHGDIYYAYVRATKSSTTYGPSILYIMDNFYHDDVYYKNNNEFVKYTEVGSSVNWHRLAEGAIQITPGSVAIWKNYQASGKELEYVWGHCWSEFGSTGSLKALAFKDSATVTFEAGTGSNFVTGFDTAPVAPSFTEGTFSAGTLPSFTEGTFSAGTLPSLGTATTGTFATEGVTVTYTEGTETLAFGIASTSSAVTAQGTFNAGTLPSKTADTFSAGTLPSKGADTFSAGTVPTLATAKALTANNTGTAS